MEEWKKEELEKDNVPSVGKTADRGGPFSRSFFYLNSS